MSWQDTFFLQAQLELFEEGNDVKRAQVVRSMKEYNDPEQLIKFILSKGTPSFLPRKYASVLFTFLEMYLLSDVDVDFASFAQMVDYMSKVCFLMQSQEFVERVDKVFQYVFKPGKLKYEVGSLVEAFEERNDCCLILAHVAVLNRAVLSQVMAWMIKNHQDQPVWLHAFAVLFRNVNNLSSEFVRIACDSAVNTAQPVEAQIDLMNAIVSYLPGDDALNFMRQNVYPIVTALSPESPEEDVLCFLELLVNIFRILKRRNVPHDKLLEMTVDIVLPLIRPSDKARDLLLNNFCELISKGEIKDEKFDLISDFSQKCIAARFPTDYNTPFIFKKPIDRPVLAYFAEHNEFPFIYLVPLFEHSDINQFINMFKLSSKKPRSFWNKVVKFLPFCQDFEKLQYIARVLLTNEDIPLVVATEIDSAYINVASQMILNPVRYTELLPITEYLRNCKANMDTYRMDKKTDDSSFLEQDNDNTDMPTVIRSPDRRRLSASAIKSPKRSPKQNEQEKKFVEEEEKQEPVKKPRLVRRRRRRSVTVESSEMQIESQDTESEFSEAQTESTDEPKAQTKKLVRRRRRIPRPEESSESVHDAEEKNDQDGADEKPSELSSIDVATESESSDKPKKKLIRRRRRRRDGADETPEKSDDGHDFPEDSQESKDMQHHESKEKKSDRNEQQQPIKEKKQRESQQETPQKDNSEDRQRRVKEKKAQAPEERSTEEKTDKGAQEPPSHQNMVLTITNQIASVPAWSAELLAIITNRIDEYDELAAAFLPILATSKELLGAFCPKSDVIKSIFFGNLLSRDVVGAELLNTFLVGSKYCEPALVIALKAMSKAENAYAGFEFYENAFVLALSYEELRSLCCHTIVLTCNMLGNRSVDFSMLIMKLTELAHLLNSGEFESSLGAAIKTTTKMTDMGKVVDAAIGKPSLEACLLEHWEESRPLFFETLERNLQSDPNIYDSFVRNRAFIPSLRYLAPVILRVSKENFAELEEKVMEMDSATSIYVLRNLIHEIDSTKKSEKKRFCHFVPRLIDRAETPGEIIPEYVEKFSAVAVSREIEFIQLILPIAQKDFVYFYCQLGISKTCHFVKTILKQIFQLVEFKEQCLACLENEFYLPEPNLSFCFLVFRKFVQFQLQEEDHKEIATLLVLIALGISRVESIRDCYNLNHCVMALSSKIGVPLGEIQTNFVFDSTCKHFVHDFFLLHSDIIAHFIDGLTRHKESFAKLSLILGYLSISLGSNSDFGKKAAQLYLENCDALLSKDELFVSNLDTANLSRPLKEKLLQMLINTGSLKAISILLGSCPHKMIAKHTTDIVKRCWQSIYRDASLDILTTLSAIPEAKQVMLSQAMLFERLAPFILDKHEKVGSLLAAILDDTNIFDRLFTIGIELFQTLGFYQHIIARSLEVATSLPAPKKEHIIRLYEIMKPALAISTDEYQTLRTNFVDLLKSFASNPSLSKLCDSICKSIETKEPLTLKKKQPRATLETLATFL